MSTINLTVDFVPHTLFQDGKVEEIAVEVKKTGAKIVMKEDEPQCVIISPEEYVMLKQIEEDREDAELLALAEERLANYDPNKTISWDEMMQELGLTEEDLEGWEEVEFE